MKDLELVVIDLAKNVAQLHGCSSTGEVVFRKQLKRCKQFCRKVFTWLKEGFLRTQLCCEGRELLEG